MGTISSGTGLISGLNIQDIVTKLMAIERQPVTDLQARVKDTDTQRTAYADLAARVLAMKATLVPLQNDSFFQSNKATSSDTNVLQVNASTKAAAGTYSVRVQQIATAQQLVSRGVADPARSTLGSGTVVVASDRARVNQSTSLDFLNSQRGVTKGSIRITDRSGATAQVDLSGAKTVQDVLDAINTASGIRVQAQVQGDKLAVVDQTGLSTGALAVADVAGGRTAQDLGIVGTSTSGQITGTDVNTVNENTLLAQINDGKGVTVRGTQADFEISTAGGSTFNVTLGDVMTTNTQLSSLNSGRGVQLGVLRVTHANGQIQQVDLSSATTIGDVIKSLSSAGLTASAGGGHLSLVDSTKGDKNLTIEDVTGHAAADLGIAGSSATSGAKQTQSITGQDVYQVRTLGDVVRAINSSANNKGTVTASISADGKSLVLKDNTTGSEQLSVSALGESTAAADLGLLTTSSHGTLTGQRLISGMDSSLLRSLNGGLGVRLGKISVTDRAGNRSQFDLTGAQSLDDVIAIMNKQQTGGAKIQVQVNDSGMGLVVNDLSGAATGTLKVEDVSGMAASDLKIAGQTSDASLHGSPLYRQYITGSTLLSTMNGGKGVVGGGIKITDSAGHSSSINLTVTSTTRLQDVINRINTAGSNLKVEARINDTGDGIVVIDNAGGPSQLKIENDGSTTASDLHIAGTADVGTDRLDGRASVEVDLDTGANLNTLVDKLNKSGSLAQASIINDGSSVTPYHLVLTAANTGTQAALAIDSGDSSLNFSTLVQAQDAVVYYGGSGSTGGVPIVSSDNQLDNVIPGATLTLTGASTAPVTVSIAKDTSTLTSQFQSFADKYNDIMSHIQDLTKYDTTTNTAGTLLGDSTVEQLRNSMYNIMNLSVGTGTQQRRLSDMGFTVGSDGQISFDQDKFNKAFNQDPDGVRTLFTTAKTGFYAQLDKTITDLTDSSTGILTQQDKTLQDRENLFNQRIADLNTLLDGKQNQLYAQFQAMESALANLQTQQAALASLTPTTTTASTTSSTSKAGTAASSATVS